MKKNTHTYMDQSLKKQHKKKITEGRHRQCARIDSNSNEQNKNQKKQQQHINQQNLTNF